MKIQLRDFNLQATLDSGQVFGFTNDSAGGYRGVIDKIPVTLRQDSDCLHIKTEKGELAESSVRKYFDLDHDLSAVYRFLTEDDRLRPAYHQLKGLRVIQQDPWEALACFIISSNNNIKRIQGIRRNLSKAFCDSEFLFPEAPDIARSEERTLRKLGLGYRAPFLLKAAKRISADGDILNRIHQESYEHARTFLMEFPGIGEKVADCVLLFGFQKYETFPVDVWIFRAVKKLYFKNRKISERKARDFAQKRWGPHAGYIQQYLYHGARSGIL